MTTQRKISPLSDHVINQIAAGEVVERPLSIVKELVENSIDASASAIEVRIESGGADLISVRDNGHGIEPTDLELAVQRHCTSKLSDAAELQQLESLGFRGEALASIAAVSKLSLSSRTETCPTASEIICSYGELSTGRPAASYPVGTMVTVEGLFANTPARRKFLRQARTENLQISQLLKHVAFSHRDVSFSLFVDGKKTFNVTSSVGSDINQRRLRELFGKEFAELAIPLVRSEQGLSVNGWVGPIDLHRPRGDIQFISVNGRVVKDRTLIHAVRLAYDGKIPEGRYASYALDIALAPDVVDVNVHPTKTEVRFAEPRHIHDQIYSFVAYSLSTHMNPAGTSEPGGETPTYRLNAEQETPPLMTAEPGFQSRDYARPRKGRSTGAGGQLFGDSRAVEIIFTGLYFERYLLANADASSTPDNDYPHQPTFVDLIQLLTSLFDKRLTQHKDSRPLIVPEILPDELSGFYAPRMGKLEELGVHVIESQSKQLLLKEVPLVLLPLNYAAFLTRLAASGSTTRKDLSGAIAAAAASSVLVPQDSTAQQRWFVQILDQLRSAKLNWQDFRVIRSSTQWQNFLGA